MSVLGKRAAIFAGLSIVALGLLLGEPSIVHAARAGDRDDLHLQYLRVPHLGRAGHVDVRRVHDARIGVGADEERVDDLSEEHRPLLDCRTGVLHHRIQPHVRGCRRRDRLLQDFLWPDIRRGCPCCRRRRLHRGHGRAGVRVDGGMVLPDGVRGNRRLNRPPARSRKG